MDPLLELRAAACLFVVGPQLSKNAAPHTEKLSYDSVLQSGVNYLLELAGGEGGWTRGLEKEGQLGAMRTVVSMLRKDGLYEGWVKKTFAAGNVGNEHDVSDSVRWLLELHRLGSMLACTQYDTLLDTMAGLKPAAVGDQSFAEWLQGGQQGVEAEEGRGENLTTETTAAAGDVVRGCDVARGCGFLHLHGVQTSPDSIRVLPYSKDIEQGSAENDSISDETLNALRQVFHNKLVLLVGFDDDQQDPLMQSFLELVYPEGDAKVLKNPPILLTSRCATSSLLQCDPCKVLHLRVHTMDNLRGVILPGEPENFSVGMLALILVQIQVLKGCCRQTCTVLTIGRK
jgi:hypothetical protein